MADARARSLAEAVCLALVCEGGQHGWSLVRELAPGGPIGRVWSLSRPLTYRAIDQLVDGGLVERRAAEPGHGAHRQPLRATAAGSATCARWFDQPVEHLRDVRTELLVKLALASRSDRDVHALLVAQRVRFAPLLAARRDAAAAGNADLVDEWRHESARAIERFLDTAIERARSARPA